MSVSGKNVSSVDSKGRVLIPQSIRDAANLGSNDKVVVEFDPHARAVLILPAHEKKLLKLQIALSDSPGALAHAASALAALGVDLVSTQSRSSKRGEAAVWEVECNAAGRSVAQIRAALSKAGAKVVFSRQE